MNIKEQCELYLKYKYEYYIIGESSISDYEFDILEKDLESTKNELALKVTDLVDFPSLDKIKDLGLNIEKIAPNYKVKRDEKKYKHLTPMLSIQKLKVEDEENLPYHDLELFLNRMNVDYYELTPKMDGNAISLTYLYDGEKHILNQALTRGDGDTGLDRTAKLKLIVPNTLSFNSKKTLQIRGEIVIDSKLFFKKYSNPDKPDNERNFVGGALSREDFSYQQITDLTFVAYDFKEIDDNNINVVENTMDTLINLGFNKTFKPLVMKIKSSADFEDFYFKFKEYRETCPFLLDGIVIKFQENLREKIDSVLGFNGKYPKALLAVKFLPDAVITKILDYEWSLGKDGHLTPILILEPIQLGGTTVSRATASNISKILSKGLYPQSQVELVKFGDIIPGIVRVTKESPMKKEYEEYVKEFIKNHS